MTHDPRQMGLFGQDDDAAPQLSDVPLTPRQASVLRTIERWIALHRYAPTVSEIAAEEQFCFARARIVVAALERKGYIRRGKNDGRPLTRAIEVLVSPPPLPAVEDE